MAQLPRNSSMAPVHWGGEDSFAQGHWESSEQSRIPEREGFFNLSLATALLGGGDEGPAALLYWVCTLIRDTTLEVPRTPQSNGSKTVRKEELGVHAVRDGPWETRWHPQGGSR